ncbi:MAG: histone deacetylase family protein [Xanthomonadales bacterium]|nr:histone deacetylase family protein [Xanthomonadales bacterium]
MLLYTHPSCLQHDPGAGHPECPARLAAVLQALHEALPEVPWHEAPLADRQCIARAHDAALVDDLLGHPVVAQRQIDPDTAMSPASAEAAQRAAGAVCAAIDAVIEGKSRRAFCAVRPPGHHATRQQAMGFCLFNSIAVGALHAQQRHGIARVAVIDFDVHHGNGTQDILWDQPGTLYVSSHQHPLYPGSGLPFERGGLGRTLNLPLDEGSDGVLFRRLWSEQLLPEIDAFAPELLLISAGFDAHRLDPLAGLNLGADDYAWITERLVDLAERHARGRVVSALEGGYSLTALRESSVAHVRALMERDA